MQSRSVVNNESGSLKQPHSVGWRTLIVTSLALFAMFFGAGNLIYPVQIGVNASSNAPLAGVGFLVTGVLLPMLTLIAVAGSPGGLTQYAARIGRIPGIVFTWLVFLSIGCFYGIPRTGAVAYEMSVGAIWGQSRGSLLAFTAVFFGITLALALNPKGLLDRIGSWLTPLLLVLLVVLIGGAWWLLPDSPSVAQPPYDHEPLLAGLLNGYNTMDAMAALVFGVVVINSLREAMGISPSVISEPMGDVQSTKQPDSDAKLTRYLFSRVALCSAIAVGILAAIYAGLVLLGSRLSDPALGVKNGAQGLALAAQQVLGPAGLVAVGLIAILACLTTSVGLVGACSEFFSESGLNISRWVWMVVIVLFSFAMANLGLESLIQVVLPVISFCYPLTIAIVAVGLLDLVVPLRLNYAYKLTVGLVAVGSIVDVCIQLNFAKDFLETWVPLAASGLSWLLPAVVGLGVGVLADAMLRRGCVSAPCSTVG